MASDMTGSYIPAQHIEAIRARVEVLAAQVQELLHEVQSTALIDIVIRRPAAPQATAPSAKTAKPAKAKKTAVSEDDIMAARAKLEASTKATTPKKEADKPIVPRQRFGKLREQLLVDFGPEVAEHMVQMCGTDKVTINLRKQRDRFIGTYPSRRQAAEAYASAVGLKVDPINEDAILGGLSDVVEHSDAGGVLYSIWGNEGDESALAQGRREAENGYEPTEASEKTAAAATA